MVQQAALLPWPHPCFVQAFKMELVPPGLGHPYGLFIPFWMDINRDKPRGRFPLIALLFLTDLCHSHGLVPLVHSWTSHPQGLSPPLGLGLHLGTRVVRMDSTHPHGLYFSLVIHMALRTHMDLTSTGPCYMGLRIYVDMCSSVH